jgi:Dolichyl-phosphate-mannose-protein mannosyltransferase
MLENPTAPASHSPRQARSRWLTVRPHVAFITIGSIGVFLRCWQYFANDSYFMDEIAVLRNLVDRPWRDLLTQPLAYGQLAPPGFLMVEKLLLNTLGSSEYSLRLFPFLCSVASVVVFALLVRGLLSRAAALGSLAMFAIAGPLILYGSQLKQYSIDVLCACLVSLAATRYASTRGRFAAYVFGITGAVCVWFSQPAVLVLGSMILFLIAGEIWRMRREPGDRRILWALAAAGVSAAASMLFALRMFSPATRRYQHQSFQGGFMPRALPTSLSNLWPYAQLHSFFGSNGIGVMAYPHPGIFTLLTAVGFGVLVFRRKLPGLVIAAPLFAVLLASAARQYPLTDRIILFLLPSFIIALAVSAETLASLAGPRGWVPWVVLSILVGFAAYPVLHRLPPYRLEPIRPAIEYVASHRQPGDKLYILHGAVPAFSYYGPRYEMVGSSTVTGSCRTDDPRQYFREVDQLRGSKRAWIIIGHPFWLYHERENLLSYLDAIGVRRSTFVLAPRRWIEPENLFHAVEVWEYDFSAPVRASSISAETFPLLLPEGKLSSYPCSIGPQSITIDPVALKRRHPLAKQITAKVISIWDFSSRSDMDTP